MRDWELVAARDAYVEQTLTELCTINRPTATNDAYGGRSTAKTQVATGVACRVHTEPVFTRGEGLEGTVPTFLVSFPYGQDVRVQDELVIAGNGTLTVTRVLKPETWALAMRVEASTGVV